MNSVTHSVAPTFRIARRNVASLTSSIGASTTGCWASSAATVMPPASHLARPMQQSRDVPRTTETSEPTTAAPIGTIGLFIPFVVVFVAVLLTGRSPAQIAGASLLLIVPAIILVLRRRAIRHAV